MDKDIELLYSIISVYGNLGRELAKLIKESAENGSLTINSVQVIDILDRSRIQADALITQELDRLLAEIE